jgi:hypothetical protein
MALFSWHNPNADLTCSGTRVADMLVWLVQQFFICYVIISQDLLRVRLCCVPTAACSGVVVLHCQLALLKYMAYRGYFVATVGIPLAKCNYYQHACGLELSTYL